MTAVFAARRRAEEFARLLDDPRAASATAAQRELLDVVAALRATPQVEPRPEFVRDLRAQLMSAADTHLVPADGTSRPTAAETARLTLPPARRRRDRRLAAAVGGLALVGATTSMAVAAQTALPGDSLYPVKRAIESVHTGLSTSDADRGEVLLANATDRLGEVSALSRGQDVPDPLVVADTLDAFADQAGDASDLLMDDYARHGRESLIRDLRDFDAASLARLTALEPLVPASARDELMDAARLLFEIDAAAQQACPTCGGVGIHEVPGAFAPVASGTTPVAVSSPTLQPRTGRPGGGSTRSGTPGTPGAPGSSLPGGTLPPGSVSTGGGGAATTQPAEDSIGELAQTLTGAALPTAGPTPGPGPLGEPGKAVKETTETVKDSIGSIVTDGPGDLIEELTDPLHP
jgi:hypothetical protein